ncbi:MAG: winged helix-turn-helix transcriptional regulator [Candidatus Rokubacteria bacterium]|nr:winged helix-turn-helix transcriptional regulator [Candidatus Rokubacteria bacterium]
MAERLRLLADATRLRVLNALREGELNVVQIVERVGATQPNVSRNLALLLRAGVVARRQDGRQVHYRIVDPFIDQICDAICGSLRAHVDRQAERLPALATAGPRTSTPSPRAATRRRRP